MARLQSAQTLSAAPQQSEICVKFSVFHTVFDVKFWWNFPSHTQTLENAARKISPKSHAKFQDSFGRKKTEKNVTSALLQGSCSDKLETFRVVKTVLLENGVFAPYRKQVILTKNGENDDLHSTHKNKGLRFSEPGNRRKWRKRRVSSDKTRVCQKQGFRHPETFFCTARICRHGNAEKRPVGGYLTCPCLKWSKEFEQAREGRTGSFPGWAPKKAKNSLKRAFPMTLTCSNV